MLAALSGEQRRGHRLPGRRPEPRPLPCLLSTEPASWRPLLDRRVEADLRAARPIDDLQRELGGRAGVRDRVRPGADLPADAVLDVVRQRTTAGCCISGTARDALDAACAARIAGYHLTALAPIVADPDAEHGRQSLLSAEELAFQLDGLAGPHRELPDRRLHELFEQRVRTHPDAVAAIRGDRQWTYPELNARANRLARALLARGLRREGVVAVVTERNLDWMAAVLAIFKAGGVVPAHRAALPGRPHREDAGPGRGASSC